MYVLGTTLLDRHVYTIDLLKDAYKNRWGIEEYLKITNHNLSLKESNAKTLNTFMQELYAKMIIICISKIISYISTHFSSVPLALNEHIHFDACLGTVTDKILKSLLYKSANDDEVINKLERTVQIMRTTVTIYKPDRHFSRCAVRTNKKWYYLRCTRKNNDNIDSG